MTLSKDSPASAMVAATRRSWSAWSASAPTRGHQQVVACGERRFPVLGHRGMSAALDRDVCPRRDGREAGVDIDRGIRDRARADDHYILHVHSSRLTGG